MLKRKSFDEEHPKEASEWHPSLNGDKKPSDYLSGSGYSAWWLCSTCGHVWKTRILHRSNGVGCPVCSKKRAAISRQKNLLKKTKSFGEAYPDFLKEWDYEKNVFSPYEITRGSNKPIFWKCLNGHPSYIDTISHRLSGRGCSVCSGHKVLEGTNDLSSSYPEISKTWDCAKNGGLLPNKLGLSSKKKYWWICDKGHSYESLIQQRIRGSGCPYCSGRKVLSGFNDLATLNSEIAKEWHPTKNGNLKPSDISAGSHVKRWWLCSRCGNEWQSAPHTRLYGSGCPKCSSERQTSFPEQAILFYLSKVTEADSRTKIDGFELDVYLPRLNVGIEYDGILYHSSEKSKIKEEKKNKFFLEKGIRLIRIKEIDNGETYIDGDIIYYKYDRIYSNLGEPIKLLFNSLKLINIEEIDIEEDRATIYSNYLTIEKKNSILTKRPEIADEWDYEKNGSINPDTISYTSGKPIHWKCKLGHTWIEDASHRYRGHNCPYCSGHRVWPGFNDIATTHKIDMLDWDYDKNTITPQKISKGSEKRVHWKCHVCGYEWFVSPSIKLKKGCPMCSNNRRKEKIAKKVLNIDLNIVFDSLHDAAKSIGILKGVTPISNCCKGKRKSAYGYHWRFVD